MSPSRFRSRLIAVDFIAFFSVASMVTKLPAISSEDFRPCFPDDFHYFGIIPILPLLLSPHATNIPMYLRDERNEKEPDMTYSRACELLNLTTPKSLEANAKLAAGILRSLVPGCPLRYSVACSILIEAAK